MNAPKKMSIGQRLRQEREANGWTQQDLADMIGAPVQNINHWENDRTRRPRPHYQKKLSDAFHKSIDELFNLPHEAIESSIWNVPHLRNLYFTGREEFLTRLQDTFLVKYTVALTQPRAINGLGGIGKTQIAIEYAYRYGNEYKAVLWVRADSHELLVSEMVNLATLLDLPAKKLSNPNIIIAAVKQWLQRNANWLLVFDNVDDIEMALEFLPTRGRGHILITTRTQPTGKNIKGIEIEKMEREEGVLFLLRRAKIIDEDASDFTISDADRKDAEAIYYLLEGLPLALDQAASYIEENQRSLQDYLLLYETHHEVLLKRRGSFSQRDYPKSVATTWSLSFELIEQDNPSAADLLRLFAFLHPDAIPEEMVVSGASELGSNLQAIAEDPIQLDDTIRELRKYSLVRRNPDTKTLTIHRLVQVVIKDRMNNELQRKWAERAVRIVNQVFPTVEQATLKLCERYLSHASISTLLIRQWEMTFVEAARLLYEVGMYFYEHAQYKQAEPLFQEALRIYEHNFGSKSSEVAKTLDKLTDSYQLQGKYKEAIIHRRQVLKIREATLSPNHPDISSALNNLATVYHDRGDYVQAEQYYLQAIEISQQAISAITSDEPYIIMHLGNLSNLYRSQGKYAEGVTYAKRALEISTTTLGWDHPQTAHSINSLATIYEKLGNLPEALTLYEQALEIRQRLLFPELPDIAESLNNLAIVYHNLGKFSKAESLLEQALAIDKKVFGPDYRSIAYRLTNLGAIYFIQEKYKEAELYYKRALEILEKNFGTKHIELLALLNNLANLYITQSTYLKAKPILARALPIAEKNLDPNHLSLAMLLQHYGNFYTAQGQFEDAEAVHMRSLTIRKSVLGENHFIVAKSLHAMAQMYAAENRNSEAEELFLRAIAMSEEGLGSNHHTLAIYLDNYTTLLRKMGREEDAQKQTDRAQLIRNTLA